MGLDDEIEAVRRLVRTTTANSKVEKVFLWVAVGVWGVVSLGIMFGYVSLDSQPKLWIWALLKAVAAYVFGRVHGKERDAVANETD